MTFILTAWANGTISGDRGVQRFLQSCRDAGWLARCLSGDGCDDGVIVIGEAIDQERFEQRLSLLGFRRSVFDRVAIYESVDERGLS